MGTSVSKPTPTSSPNPSESEARDTRRGPTELPHPDHHPVPATQTITRSKDKGKGNGNHTKRSNKSTAIIAPAGQEVKRLAKTDTGSTPPRANATATATATAAATAATPATAPADTTPAPGKWTYEGIAPFLRSEGWNCADGHGFHTWFFVSQTADGKKNVDYLVSEKEVVAFVRRDRSVLARYEAFLRGHAVGTGSSGQDSGGGVPGPGGGRAAVGTHSPGELCAGTDGGRHRRSARRASSPALSRSTGAGRGSNVATIGRSGSRSSTIVPRRLKGETPTVGVTEASTARSRCLRGAPIVGGVAGAPTGSDGRSAKEAPITRATRTSARVGRSTRYNSLFKPASASAAAERPTKTSPVLKTPTTRSASTTGSGQTPNKVPAVQKVGPATESGVPAKDNKPTRRAARPSTVAAGAPVNHSAIVQAAAEAAERAAGLGFPAAKQRAQQRGLLPQEPEPPAPTVDWAGRDKAEAPAPGTATLSSSPDATHSRTEVRARLPAAEPPRRSASTPAPQKPLRGGWAASARPQADGQKQQHAGPLGSSRKRSRETANWEQSWRETWPTLREEGWHWEYGKDLGATCVYLKPGVSREVAVLGVDMFDSKRSVVQHVLDSPASGAAAVGAFGDSPRGSVDGSGGWSAKKPSVGERPRASRKQRRLGDETKPRPSDDERESGDRGPRVVPASQAARADKLVRESSASSKAAAGVVNGGSSLKASSAEPRGHAKEGPGGRASSGSSPVEELARGDSTKEQAERWNERPSNNAKDAPAPCRAERGQQVGRPAPGPPSKPLADVRTRQSRETVGGGEEAPAGNQEGIDLAASVVMEMLRAETTAEAGPAEKRRVVPVAGRELGPADAGVARWGVDKLAAHCCEQLVALSQLGGAGGVAGKPSGGGGGGGNDSRAEAGSGGGGDSCVDGAVDRILKRKVYLSDSSQRSDLGRSESKKKRDGGGPSADKNEKGAAGPSTTFGRLPGPLSGVGVVVAGIKGAPRKEVEAEIVRLGGEVVEIFSKDGAADEWRARLLGEYGQAAAGGSAASKNGDGGPTRPSACKLMSVAAPGSDRTPEFQLAVAAGVPIVHPSYLGACSTTGAKVETAEYLMPYGRSALGSRGLIMPSRSTRERPFQGKTIILCVNDRVAAGEETAVENLAFTFRVAGATVKVLKDDGCSGRSGGGGGSSSAGAASAAGTDSREADHRCTLEGARKLLAEGGVHCVIGPSMDGASPALPAAAAAALQAAVDAGILTGTLEWATQCMAHGRLLLPSSETCPWFPVGTVAAGGPSDGTTTSTAATAGGGCSAPKTEVGGSAGASGGGGVDAFHVHVTGGTSYVAGDYVFLRDHHEFTSYFGGGSAGGAATEGGGGVGTAGVSGDAGSLPLVARIQSFRREANGAVRVAVEVLDRGDDPNVLVKASRGVERQEVGDGVLGGRVLVLTSTEAEAARLYSSKDSGVFCLGD